MVSTSKILTVSYGTFSCTLEGFDDSFETMKAIAEYFRDLASDDRYFGAEPPTPDAEMLARIAEREIARRVEAHENEGRIVLRAAEAAAEAEEAAPEPAPQAKPEPKQIAAAAALASVEDGSEALKTAIHAHTDTAEEAPEDEAAAEVAIETPPQEQQPLAAAAPAAEEPVIAEDEIVIEEEPTDDADDDAALQEAMADLTAEDDDADDDDYVDEEPNAFANVADEGDDDLTAGYDEDYAEDDAEEVIIPPAPAADEADSVAARLRRIRSVVAHSSDSYATDDYSEDEHAQDFLQRTAEELDATLAEDDAAVARADDVAEDSDEDDFADLSARLAEAADEATEEPEAETAEADADEPELDDGMSEDTLSQLLADAMPADDVAAREDVAEAETDDARQDDLDAEDDAAPFVLTGEQATAEPERPLRARVLKMKRSEFEAAIASGQIEEDFDEDEAPAAAAPEAAAPADDTDAMLSPEDEAELQRELAEVEAEMEQGAAFDEAPAAHEMLGDEAGIDETDFEDAEPVRAEADEPEQMFEERAPAPGTAPVEAAMDEADDMPGARRAARLQGSDTESDASRLFDTADTHFEAPDSNKRRNAIQHLRAAVAATKAEKNAGSTLEQETDEDPYRSDLASVVRPRRHRAMGSDESPRSRRPGAETRQAPLKLVAEQRVDTPRDPVRPRRVSAQLSGQAESAPVEEGGFSEFAEQIGASTLPELLEAAAAYMADIEGRQQFSRPMLMGKLKEVELDAFSREDGLRSFGHLLRQGKLQKVKGGRFSITDQTEFRAQARHAG